MTIEGARSAAIAYACFAFAAGLLLLISAIEQLPDGWRKVVAAVAMSVFVPLPPILAIQFGERRFKMDSARKILAWGVTLSCLVPVAILLLVAMSPEPLAMLALLYVPPLQLVVLAITLLVGWQMDRA